MITRSNHTHGTSTVIFIAIVVLFIAAPVEAFGAGYVSKVSHLKGTRFRHGDIALAIPLLATANRRLVKQIYFGNWLRDFSQILDKGSLSLVPRPVLRALVAVFAFVQFGYATREFEVTDERLGFYRLEEHVDNPKGYNDDPHAVASTPQASANEKIAGYQISEGLRSVVHPPELDIDPKTAMKNYIANSVEVGPINPTSADYVEKQLIAAIACGRQGDEEAYIHLGAALHTLEDFAAHSNYVELAMQTIGQELQDRSKIPLALGQVFAFVGDGAKVKTARGSAPPVVTGTFGALDLYLTLLGEIDDKLSAMSLPGLKVRIGEKEGALQAGAKYLIALLEGLTPNFETDILKIQKAAMKSQPATWGELEEKPEKLWDSLEPVFKLRDDVVKWVYDHLTVRAVQDALAAISTAIDKLVYTVIGFFVGPLLSELSNILEEQEQQIIRLDEAARLASGEQSIFDAGSSATNPTHSQLAKDHYDHTLNDIAGRVAVCISSFTTETIIRLWQPGNTRDPRMAIHSILEAFHHPFNSSTNSLVQSLMLDEVRTYINDSLVSKTETFESDLRSLSKSAIASRINEHHGVPDGHFHVHNDSTTDLRTAEQQNSFLERLGDNIKRQLKEGSVKGFGIDDFPAIQKLFLESPTGESPNPLDTGLAKLSGISFLSTFKGLEISEIAATDGMGETLKDAIISMILLDETRGATEEELAAGKFRMGKNESKEVQRQILKESRAMLKIQRINTQQGLKQFDEKRSTGEKLKDGTEKLKLKASMKT